MNSAPPRFESDDELESMLAAVDYGDEPVVLMEAAICAVCAQTEDYGHPDKHAFLPLRLDGSVAVTGRNRPLADVLREQIKADRERTLWRFGRMLKRLDAQDEELRRYFTAIADEVNAARERIARRVAVLDGMIAGEALRRREEEGVKTLTVPGAGEWRTRTVPAAWVVADEKAVVESLAETPDEYQQFVTQQPHLDRAKFRAWLEQAGFAEFPGADRRAERVSVSSPYSAGGAS